MHLSYLKKAKKSLNNTNREGNHVYFMVMIVSCEKKSIVKLLKLIKYKKPSSITELGNDISYLC